VSADKPDSKDQPTLSLAEDFKQKAHARVAELLPYVEEHQELTTMLDKLEGKASEPEVIYAPEPSKPAAPSTAKPKGTGKPRRKRAGGTRRDQAVALVTQNPGISAGDISKALDVKVNYLYRVMADAVEDGEVKKDGSGYVPA
jgi:hypothetical protein